MNISLDCNSIFRQLALILVLLMSIPTVGFAQRPGEFQRGGPERSGREAAPIDLTGYWAALITDDWQYRMIVPAHDDFSWLPLSPEGLRVAASWDPAADEAAGEACKAYAAPAIMRLPTRLRISWQSDDILQVETDTGTQTRMFHFDHQPAEGERTWQGHSVATWEMENPGGRGRRVFEDASDGNRSNAGNLLVETSHLRPGYLRKNGAPFSDQTVMSEHFNILIGRDGERYLVVQTYVDDPVYLVGHFVRTLLFKSEDNGSMWNPTRCVADGWDVD